MEQTQISTTIRLKAPFYSVKRTIAGALCHPFLGKAISRVFQNRIPSRGCVIRTDSKVILPTVKASLFWGFYESAEIRFVRKYLREDLDVVELGSSLGVVTSQIMKKLRPDCAVLCVEANPHLLATLKSNIQENGNGRRVMVVHGAIVDSFENNRNVELVLGEDNTGSHVGAGDASEETVAAPGFTLSTILRIGPIRDDFVLVSDIEGAEVYFIENDDGALRRCRQLIIELHEMNWKGTLLTVDYLRSRLERLHGFKLIESYGPVCVFERS